MKQTWTVYYRTGGTDNFRWHRLSPGTLDEAVDAWKDIRRGGRVAYYQRTELLDAIGMPETYSAWEILG